MWMMTTPFRQFCVQGTSDTDCDTDGCFPLGWSGSGSVIQDHSDHDASKEAKDTCPEWIHRDFWCTMIPVILDHWSRSRSSQRNTPQVSIDARVSVFVSQIGDLFLLFFFLRGVSRAQIGFLQGLTFNFLMSIPASLTWEAPTAGKKGTFLVRKLFETLRADEINREEFTNKNQELVHKNVPIVISKCGY